MLSVPLFGVVYLRCLSSFWRCGHFRCRLVQLPQWSGCTAFLFADELTEDFFNRLHSFYPRISPVPSVFSPGVSCLHLLCSRYGGQAKSRVSTMQRQGPCHLNPLLVGVESSRDGLS